MQVSQHKPLFGNGKAYLNHFKKFDQVSKELDNSPSDGFRPGGSMEKRADLGTLKGEFISGFRNDGMSTTISRYKNTKNSTEVVNVSDTFNGGQGKLGTVVDRDYSDRGDTLRVSEHFQTFTDAEGNGTDSLATFVVNKQTGAIAMFEGSPLEKSGFPFE